MFKEPRRVRVEPGTNLLRLLEEMKTDKEPRLLERDGEDIAVVLSADDYAYLSHEAKSKMNKAKLLSFAGLWKDLDTDRMLEGIYEARHESPPSPPVEL